MTSAVRLPLCFGIPTCWPEAIYVKHILTESTSYIRICKEYWALLGVSPRQVIRSGRRGSCFCKGLKTHKPLEYHFQAVAQSARPCPNKVACHTRPESQTEKGSRSLVGCANHASSVLKLHLPARGWAQLPTSPAAPQAPASTCSCGLRSAAVLQAASQTRRRTQHGPRGEQGAVPAVTAASRGVRA